MAASTQDFQWSNQTLSGMSVQEGELAAVTGDDSDAPQLQALVAVLHRLREAFGMEMVFIGEVRGGLISCREAPPDDSCNPFEEGYGRQLLEARCGSSMFDAISVRSQDGLEVGTLVCGVRAGDGHQPPPDSLKSVSRLLATSMRRLTRA